MTLSKVYFQANALLNEQNEVALCDFGLAKSEYASGLTTTESFKGSIPWCSPELFDDDPRTPYSDVWALGCLVVEV